MDRQPLTDRLGDRLLSKYGGAAAAYSLRALNGNGDNVVRVRRASDNDEKDFTAEQIELGEMVNWVTEESATADGFVETWYDQSGNGRDATQATTTNQPQIVASGALVTDANGNPAIDFDGTKSLYGATLPMVFVLRVLKYDSAASVYNDSSTRVVSNQGVSFDNQSNLYRSRSFGSLGGINVGVSVIGTLTQSVVTSRHVNENFAVWVNGADHGTSTSDIGFVAESTQPLRIGGKTGNSGGSDFDGQFSEYLVWGIDQTANRTAIEGNINAHYNIYP